MPRSRLRKQFQQNFGRPPAVTTRAPGRVEFIGNHTDYNGGAVLGVAIDRGVEVAAAPAPAGDFRVRSTSGAPAVELSSPPPVRLEGASAWANYVFGVWHSLADFSLPRPAGFDLLVDSDLPAGAGLSSSAALELATALALTELAQAPALPLDQLAKLGRHAENKYVGVPCGILDQGTSAFGAAGHLVHIDCRGPTFTRVPLPTSAHLWIFNTREKHALVDGLYATRHRECTEAAKALGVAFLTDLTPAQLAASAGKLSPVVARRAQHVVEEHARVGETVAALQRGDLAAVGKLITASHRSSQRLFENSTPSLDRLVDALAKHPAVHGARLTGGGFGGAVLALTKDTFGPDDADAIARGLPHPAEILHLQSGGGGLVMPAAPRATLPLPPRHSLSSQTGGIRRDHLPGERTLRKNCQVSRNILLTALGQLQLNACGAARVGWLAMLLGLTLLSADITLAPLFRDGAVLQRDTPIPVWGRARPGENVVVRFGADTVAITTSADGRWLVRLPARPASTVPAELTVEGDNRLVVRDMLLGDVWLCGGQSNMMMSVRNVRDAEQEIAAAKHPLLRFFKVATQFAAAPADTVGGEWQAVTPETIGPQSATAYFFGRELVTKLGVPVGLIVSSYGNTAIATWRSPAALAGDDVIAAWWQRQQQATPPPRPHRQPSAGHQGMIAPLAPYAVRGFLWYQGEADATESRDFTPRYAAQLTGLVREWRALFGAGRPLPFYWVQLAGFGRAAPRDWTGVREQQTRALAEPATGQAIALDLGDETDIHPRNKQEVGTRLARLALHRTYGLDIADTGPAPQAAELAGSTVAIRFDTSALRAQGDLATAFALAGADGRFHRADRATIAGQTVTLAAKAVPLPVTVRFAWQDLPTAFLYNGDQLPAAPFQLSVPASR